MKTSASNPLYIATTPRLNVPVSTGQAVIWGGQEMSNTMADGIDVQHLASLQMQGVITLAQFVMMTKQIPRDTEDGGPASPPCERQQDNSTEYYRRRFLVWSIVSSKPGYTWIRPNQATHGWMA